MKWPRDGHLICRRRSADRWCAGPASILNMLAAASEPRWWLAATLLLGACYPDFQFGSSGPGGNGGNGGDPSSSRSNTGGADDGVILGPGSGGSTSSEGGEAMHPETSAGGFGGQSTDNVGGSTSSEGGGEPGPITVPCGDGDHNVSDCAVGESCCFGSDDSSLDHCQATTNCGGDYYTFQCNGQADCPGEECCVVFDAVFGFDGRIECLAACDTDSYRACADVADCMSGEECVQIFTDAYAPEYAPHYRACI